MYSSEIFLQVPFFCRYQKCCDPQHQVSDVIGVGEIARRHHLTDPNWNVQTAQDPGEDLHTYSEELRLDHETPKKYINRGRRQRLTVGM